MAQNQAEATVKSKLHILHVKLSAIKDEELSNPPNRLSLKNEIVRFREILVEYETCFCRRLSEITIADDIQKAADAYTKDVRKYEIFIEEKEIQLQKSTAAHEPAAPAQEAAQAPVESLEDKKKVVKGMYLHSHLPDQRRSPNPASNHTHRD